RGGVVRRAGSAAAWLAATSGRAVRGWIARRLPGRARAWLARKRSGGKDGRDVPGASPSELFPALGQDLAYTLSVGVALTAVVALWYAASPALFRAVLARDAAFLAGPFTGPGHHAEWPLLFAPALVWAVPAGAFLLLRGLASRFTRTPAAVRARSSADRATGRLILLTGAWCALAGLWLVALRFGTRAPEAIAVGGDATMGGRYLGAAGVLTWLFLWARKKVGEDMLGKGLGTGVLDRLKPLLPQVLAYAVIALALVALSAELLPWLAGGSAGDVALAAGAVTVTGLVFFDPNRIGLHSFYRGRLTRAYLGASNGEVPNRTTEEQAGDDIALDRMQDGGGPLHLVCCAANDLTPADPLANLQRGARSAVLSRAGFLVGSDWRRWTASEPGRARSESPTLGAAATASGAAVNSLMGVYSMRFGPAVSFLMTALNFRLGRWIKHPRHADGEVKDWWLPGALFYKELLGLSNSDDGDVHLSDGGHFENLALYELLRRHCRYILVCDCGADPDVAFNDIANVVRLVREDFGIEISIDLSPLRPDADGFARQPMVAGDILYPGGDPGVLLVVKPTVVGDEPGDVLQYKRRNPAFPHEPTLDQFYDNAQWESYRRLGQHAVESSFAFARSMGEGWWQAEGGAHGVETRREAALRLFARARFEWLPRPPGFPERFPRLARRALELERRLVEAGGAGLLAGLYREVPEVLGQLGAAGAAGSAGPVGAAGPHGSAGGSTAAGTAAPAGQQRGRRLQDTDERIAVAIDPTPEEAVASLLAAREAILFLEEAYHSEDLARHCRDPLYLGLVNYIGRRTCAPAFRLWWPLLRGLSSPAFVRFIEGGFDVPQERGRGATVRIAAGDGLAATCARLAHGERRETAGVPLELRLPLSLGGGRALDVQ
ncbi:MAG TPA: hypothetical protein VMK65_00675, partial [Longimicrobiales bacterium]|nr:hypothetical protein [Longimicrobiales bacterium]